MARFGPYGPVGVWDGFGPQFGADLGQFMTLFRVAGGGVFNRELLALE